VSPRRSSALDRLLAEVRAQRPPSAADPGLPPRLRAAFRSAAAGWLREPPRPARMAAAWRWLPALALAAAAAVAVLARSGSLTTPGAPSTPIAALDGQPLDVGALVIAADRPRRVEHAGRASWELAPGSRARVLSVAGGVLRVSLEQGSLVAEVHPSAQPESFVVQAQGTEVAVHGTRFGVSLIGDHVRVSVAQGLVQVRPLALAAATLPIPGTSLRAGMQADFWAGKTEPAPAVSASTAAHPPASAPEPLPENGLAPLPAAAHGQTSGAPAVSRGAHTPRPGAPLGAKPSAALSPQLQTPGRVAGSAAGATAAAPGAAAAPGTAAVPPAPVPPAPRASVEQALQTVTEHVQSCFRQQLPGSSELGIEAATRLGLWVEHDGELLRADFDPPLAPAVERCVAAQLAHLRVAPSPAGFRVEREIRLRR
jgi:ferric-dicitrate binding protein FerR (iron transport regulator)